MEKFIMRDSNIQKNSQAILLLHSFTHSPKVMFYLASKFKKEGYKVYTPYFSGHDNVKIIDTLKVSVRDWFIDGNLALNHLIEAGYKEVVVVGQSLGGVITLDLLQKYPEIIKGVVLSTPGFTQWNFNKIYDEVEKRVYRDAEQDLVNSLEKEVQAAKIKAKRLLSSLNLSIQQLEKNYCLIKQPLFIGQAINDSIVPKELATKLNDSVSNSQLYFYNSDQHILSTSKINQQVYLDILSFIKQ